MPHLVSDVLNITSRMAMMRAKRFVAMPFTLADSLKTLASGEMEHPFGGLDIAKCEAQILIDKIENSQREAQGFSLDIIKLLGASDFASVAKVFRGMEADLRSTSWGARYHTIVAEVVEHWVLNGAGEYDQHPEAAAKDRLAWLSAAFDASPDDHALAVLVARAHIALGWAYRGDGWAESVSDKGWEALAYHGTKANQALERFEAFECRSPGLAAALHMAARWQPDRDALAAAYADWRALDPTCTEVYGAHAFFTLPRWGGTHFEVELMAKQAARDTQDQLGDGAYALVYMHLMDTEPELIEIADVARFERGILDLVERLPDTVMVNQCLSIVAELLLEMTEETPKEPEVVAWTSMTSRLAATLVNHHLNSIALDLWEDPERPLLIIGSIYRRQIEEGASIAFEKDAVPRAIYTGADD